MRKALQGHEESSIFEEITSEDEKGEATLPSVRRAVREAFLKIIEEINVANEYQLQSTISKFKAEMELIASDKEKKFSAEALKLTKERDDYKQQYEELNDSVKIMRDKFVEDTQRLEEDIGARHYLVMDQMKKSFEEEKVQIKEK